MACRYTFKKGDEFQRVDGFDKFYDHHTIIDKAGCDKYNTYYTMTLRPNKYAPASYRDKESEVKESDLIDTRRFLRVYKVVANRGE